MKIYRINEAWFLKSQKNVLNFDGTQDGTVTVLKLFQKTRPGSMSKTVDILDASSELMISDSKNFDTVFFELKMEQ